MARNCPHTSVERAARDVTEETRRDQVAWIEQEAPVADHRAAVRTLVGACLLGALEHVGTADLARAGRSSREDVRLVDLRATFRKRDSGLHGCGWEFAVHAALHDSASIPSSIRNGVLTALSSEVGAIFGRQGVPVRGWGSGGLRSVMYGLERARRDGYLDVVVADLGAHSLIWPGPGASPYRLAPLIPELHRCPRQMGLRNRQWETELVELPRQLPPALSGLWKTDLFLGGATVELTKEVTRLLGSRLDRADGPPTAWLAATVKYRRGTARPAAGLHLGIESSYTPKSARVVAGATRRIVDGMPVVTLGLDSAFAHAFNQAWSLTESLLTSLHPTRVPLSWLRELGRDLRNHRDQPVVELAEELLAGGQRDLMSVKPAVAVSEKVSFGATVAPLPLVTAA